MVLYQCKNCHEAFFIYGISIYAFFSLSENTELIAASVPAFSAITLILKGLLHNLPSCKELPLNW